MTKHSHASTQCNLPEDLCARVLAFDIDPKHLLEREINPHVTVKFGVEAGHSDVKKALAEDYPAKATFHRTSLFKNADADVLKVDVSSADLHRLHRKLNRLPHDDSHMVYRPHVTIAYLHPGSGKYYEGVRVRGVTGKTAMLRSVLYSGKDGRKKEISLGEK